MITKDSNPQKRAMGFSLNQRTMYTSRPQELQTDMKNITAERQQVTDSAVLYRVGES